MSENTEKALARMLFREREDDFVRASYDREIAFYESIGSGNIDMMHFFASPLFGEGCGTLSHDPIRNLRYHLIITAALVARFCIKYGMTPEMAYQMSDVYIMQADEAETEEELRTIHMAMLEGYTRRMQRVHNSRIYSKQIVKAIEYINEHLHSKILLSDVARALELSPSYLSRLFKQETEMCFNDFVNYSKIDSAAKLVLYSDHSDADIANLYSFSSQSYFIKQFKKYMKMTPGEYKAKYRFPAID